MRGTEPERGTGDGDGARPLSRRRFLGAAGTLGAAALAGGAGGFLAGRADGGPAVAGPGPLLDGVEPFYGVHQGGVTTTPQAATRFAAFDVTTDRPAELVGLLRRWTAVAADLTAGRPVGSPREDADAPEADSGEAVGLGPARLTVNVGFGPSLFGLSGPDRFGLRDRWPEALVPLPAFPGDQLAASDSGADLTVHACADDPQVAFHAIRQLARAAQGTAALRWSQAGFNEQAASGGTPRDLLGFRDGTVNPGTDDELDLFVWVRGAGPEWMIGGTYVVVRRIRIDLARWDALPVDEQERVIGRHKRSGAPLGGTRESEAPDLSARGPGGRLVIPVDAHVRVASPQENWGQMLLRRSYAYDNGVVAVGGGVPALDAGLLFVAYQNNPRTAFIPIFEQLAERDALSPFVTHTASAVAALPSGAAGPGDWIGRRLFEA